MGLTRRAPQCPAPTFAGEVQFACNTLTQQCQCAVAIQTRTPCTSNGQCGASSQCTLASLASGTSYGTLPCGQCQTHNVYCMVDSGGWPGQCTCYLDNLMPQAVCSDASGAVTPTDASDLCGYTQDTPAVGSNWQFSIDDLAMVSCALATQAVCSTVWATSTTSVRLAVATGLQVSRRRLLWDAENATAAPHNATEYGYERHYEPINDTEIEEALRSAGWEAAAEPCRGLALSYQRGEALSVLERHAASVCAYWRRVGARAASLFNISAPDTFLVSVDDLAEALARPDILGSLVSRPWSLLYAALFHPWMRPLRAVSTVLANWAERHDWVSRWAADRADRAAAEELLDVAAGDHARDRWVFGPPNASELRARRHRPRRRARQVQTPNPAANTSRRTILSILTDIASVQQMSATVAGSGDATVSVPDQVAQAWGQGPFVWPPNYQYLSGACPLASQMAHTGKEALSVVVLYYANWNRPTPPIDRSLRAALPSANWNVSASARLPQRDSSSWPTAVFNWLFGTMLGMDQQDVATFFSGNQVWTFRWLVSQATTCDLAAVVTCSDHKRDLVASLVVLLAFYYALTAVAAPLGLSLVAYLYIRLLPLIVLWYVYGVGPSCFPMLPTCLLSDLVSIAEWTIPASLSLPPEIVVHNATLNTTTLRPCAELNFTTWADPLAFALCDADQGLCEWVASLPSGGVASVEELQVMREPARRSPAGNSHTARARRLPSGASSRCSIPRPPRVSTPAASARGPRLCSQFRPCSCSWPSHLWRSTPSRCCWS